jgi:hypothetical protein
MWRKRARNAISGVIVNLNTAYRDFQVAVQESPVDLYLVLQLVVPISLVS